MLDFLRRPLSPAQLAILASGLTLLVALYCLAYTALAGRPESVSQALGWAVANVLPWIVAIELAKRARQPWDATLILIAACAASLVLGYTTSVSADAVAFELVRRLPSLAFASALVALLRSPIGRDRQADELPLLARQIEWVRAAGNYVELRAAGRTIVHRAALSAVEQELADHGFIRIHRSMLVKRDLIARIRPEDVILTDGTHLRIGKRYRAALAA